MVSVRPLVRPTAPTTARRFAKLGLALALLLTGLLAGPGAVPAAAQADEGTSLKRVALPTLNAQQDYPYTVEIPSHWEVRRDIPAPGVFLGPPGGTPESHPEMIFVRFSQVDLADAEAVAANIQANSEQTDQWSAPEIAVEEVAAGIRGVRVLMSRPGNAGEDEGRNTLALKLPLSQGSVDVMATAPVSEFSGLRGLYEQILGSVEPVGQPTGQPMENPGLAPAGSAGTEGGAAPSSSR